MSPDFNPQAAFEQVTQRLDAMQASQNQTQQILLQTVDIQTEMLKELRQTQATQAQMQVTQAEMQVTQAQMQATQAEMQADIRQLRDSHLTLLKVQNGMMDFMKFTFDKQAQWNERQDQFNIIFLDELRDLKREVRQRDFDAKTEGDKMYKELKDRLGRLEDFMNDQLRKAS